MGLLKKLFNPAVRDAAVDPRGPSAQLATPHPEPPPIFEASRVFNQLRLDIHRFRAANGGGFVAQSERERFLRPVALSAAMDRALDQILAGHGLLPEHPLERVDRRALYETLTFFGFRYLASEL